MHKPPLSVGWEFEAFDPDTETSEPVHFSTTGSYSVDFSRDVARTISGFTLLPHDRDRIDLSSSRVRAYLVLDGVRHRMSEFVFTEEIRQKSVVLNPETNEVGDITTVSLGDVTTLLIRNTGRPETLYAGFSPTFEIVRIVQLANLDIEVSTDSDQGSNSEDITWDGTTTDLAKIRQLAELAGHLSPWLDNYGTLRSVSAGRAYGVPLEFEKDIFLADADSVSVTSNYLTVPNRVIVTSNASPDYAIRGQWDAPASWPSSEARRGYVRAQVQEVQGIQSDADAQRVAESIGRRSSARHLTARIWPTHLLDGPRIIKFDDTYWTIQSWSVDTEAGSVMDIEAEEYFMDEVLSVASFEPPVVI